MKTITLNFGDHTGSGGYGYPFRWTWRTHNRVYIKGHWTPFMIVDYHFKCRVFHRLVRFITEFFVWLRQSFLSLRSN